MDKLIEKFVEEFLKYVDFMFNSGPVVLILCALGMTYVVSFGWNFLVPLAKQDAEKSVALFVTKRGQFFNWIKVKTIAFFTWAKNTIVSVCTWLKVKFFAVCTWTKNVSITGWRKIRNIFTR